jgi:hypothetical protein
MVQMNCEFAGSISKQGNQPRLVGCLASRGHQFVLSNLVGSGIRAG